MELLVTIAIIAVLATLAVAAAQSVIGKSRSAKCSNFMRQLGAATMLYAGDNDNTLPSTIHQRQSQVKSWTITLQKYASGKLAFRCPDDRNEKRGYTYVLNDFLTPNPGGATDINFTRLSSLERPTQTLLFGEATEAYADDHFHFAVYRGRPIPMNVFEGDVATRRHQGDANYVFADGHMETLSRDKVKERLETPRSRFVDPTYED